MACCATAPASSGDCRSHVFCLLYCFVYFGLLVFCFVLSEVTSRACYIITSQHLTPPVSSLPRRLLPTFFLIYPDFLLFCRVRPLRRYHDKEGESFYPGTGKSDSIEKNVINCPLVPIWAARKNREVSRYGRVRPGSETVRRVLLAPREASGTFCCWKHMLTFRCTSFAPSPPFPPAPSSAGEQVRVHGRSEGLRVEDQHAPPLLASRL